MADSIRTEMGFYGNIWVLAHYFKDIGDVLRGHIHTHDHVTLLAKGAVICQVEGYPDTKYKAPTFIVIDKNHEHNFTALEEDTTLFCIHSTLSMRDVGDDPMYQVSNSPLGQSAG